MHPNFVLILKPTFHTNFCIGVLANHIMRIAVHDYAGHPFQVELSRNLARRGHEVLHLYSRSIQTPQGKLQKLSDDPAGFDIVGIALSSPLEKYSTFARRRQDIEHGCLALEEIRRFKPDSLISGNTWIDAQSVIQRYCRSEGVWFTYWVQDLFGIGIHRVLRKKIPVLGELVGRYYKARERRLLRNSDAIVAITDDFVELFEGYGVPRNRVHVIKNWAPLDDVSPLPKQNKWAKEHGVADKFCFLYSGTMGMKHNPELMLQIARRFARESDVAVMVVSEGIGAEWLKAKKAELGLSNLKILDFQPFEELPQVLASADVLVAVLEPDGGVFSVPSKVLTYLCARRPLLLAVPSENLASRIVARNEAGITSPPDDPEAFVEAAIRLHEDEALRGRLADNGRSYAEKNFDIARITKRFEGILVPAQ